MSGAGAAPWWDSTAADLLPPDPDLELLHNRDYVVRAWRRDERSILMRGAVMDRRPGDFLADQLAAAGGDDDGGPFTIHHMVVELVVALSGLMIEEATVLFETAPHGVCPSIADNYQDLVGISIARGFTHAVRERFGGPRGCTHTTALLQAMAPVAVQATLSVRVDDRVYRHSPDRPPADPAQISSMMRDTCHAWAEPGPFWQGILAGETPPMPLTYRRRIREAGLDPADFDERLRD